MALRADVPTQLLAMSPDGAQYYTGLNTEDAYRPLCRSHHGREGALRAAAHRSPAIAAGVVRDRLEREHDCTGATCEVCQLLADFDVLTEALIAAEAGIIERRSMIARSAVPQEQGRVDICERGHELIGANLVLSDLRRGGRACLACKRALDRGRGKSDFPVADVADRIYAQLMAS